MNARELFQLHGAASAERAEPVGSGDWLDATSWLRRQQETVAMRCVSKEVEDLTEEEKVAVCYVAGAPMKIEPGAEGFVKLTTARRVGIVKINGVFKVLVEAEHVRSRGQTITIPVASNAEL